MRHGTDRRTRVGPKPLWPACWASHCRDQGHTAGSLLNFPSSIQAGAMQSQSRTLIAPSMRCGALGSSAARVWRLSRSSFGRLPPNQLMNGCYMRGPEHPTSLVKPGAHDRKPASPSCPPSNAASKTTVGPNPLIEGIAASQSPNQKAWDAPSAIIDVKPKPEKPVSGVVHRLSTLPTNAMRANAPKRPKPGPLENNPPKSYKPPSDADESNPDPKRRKNAEP